jgi:hypothetical protein
MRNVHLSPVLSTLLADGFGPSKDGEDLFDATVGLFSMLEVVLGHRAPGEPATASVRNLEGWILGQQRPESWPPDLKATERVYQWHHECVRQS